MPACERPFFSFPFLLFLSPLFLLHNPKNFSFSTLVCVLMLWGSFTTWSLTVCQFLRCNIAIFLLQQQIHFTHTDTCPLTLSQTRSPESLLNTYPEAMHPSWEEVVSRHWLTAFLVLTRATKFCIPPPFWLNYDNSSKHSNSVARRKYICFSRFLTVCPISSKQWPARKNIYWPPNII